jgi:hypothetical protein
VLNIDGMLSHRDRDNSTQVFSNAFAFLQAHMGEGVRESMSAKTTYNVVSEVGVVVTSLRYADFVKVENFHH